MIRDFWLLLWHDIRLSLLRSRTFVILLFYILTTIVLGFIIGKQPHILVRIAPSMIWLMVVLTTLFSLETLFHHDVDDGTLEVLWLFAIPMELIFITKTLAHWIVTIVYLLLATPFVAYFLYLDHQSLSIIGVTLLLGTPSLSLIGSVGASLTIGIRHSGPLLILLMLPFSLPILIFALSAVEALLLSLSVRPHLVLLVAYFLIALPLSCYAGSTILRHTLCA